MPHAHDSPGLHSAVPRTGERRLLWTMLLTGGFMLVELVGGILSGSLTLIADAGHMLTDVGALGLAYAAARVGRRPADRRRSYGYRRLEVLAAFVNGLAMLVLAAWIAFEGVRRLFEPVEVLSGPMLLVAVVGLFVNVAAYFMLSGHAHANVNVSGALLHVLGDLVGSIAAIIAALVIAWTGWTPIDPLLALLVAFLVVRSSIAVLRRSGHILLEGTPEDVEPREIASTLAALPGVAEVHHIHVWQLTSGQPLATLHLRLAEGADPMAAIAAAKARLREEFGIEHSTIEIGPPRIGRRF